MIYLAQSGSGPQGPQHDEPARAHRWTTREVVRWSRSSRRKSGPLANGELQLLMEFNLVATDRGRAKDGDAS